MDSPLDLDRPDIRRANNEMNGRMVQFDSRPRIWRETESATEINRILNHPSVFCWSAQPGQKAFDVSRIVVDPRIVFLRCEGGVVIFAPDPEMNSGMWETHGGFLEGYRGSEALECCREMMAWMFCRTSATMLWTRIPAPHQAALAMIRATGATLWFHKTRSFQTETGPVDERFYMLTIHDWMRKASALPVAGKLFHRRIVEDLSSLGDEGLIARWREAHDDEDQDRFIGACTEMIRGGQPQKGVILYNRWARIAGSPEISLISTDPVVIETSGVMIHAKGDFRVVKAA